MWADLRSAFSFLTIVPLGYGDGRKAGWSFTGFPLVGLFIGLLLAGTASLNLISPEITAFLTLIVWVIVTGGLHLDGFGDSCDGLLATVQPERRLEIMKDPRAGSWAVVGLVLLLLGKWLLLQQVTPLLVIAVPVIGRWNMVVAAFHFPYARSSGMGAYFRDGLGWPQVLGAAALTLVICLAVVQQMLGTVLVFVFSTAFALLMGTWAARRLGGGLTGDIYGALCELTELVCLLGLGIWLNG